MTELTGIPCEGDLAFRTLLSTVMAECGKTRSEIASCLTRKVGRDVKLSALNDFTATTKLGARFPACYVSAFCEVTGDDRLRHFLLNRKSQALLDLGEQTLNAEGRKSKLIREILDAGQGRP